MSTIKVNSIKNTATNDGGIAIDNSGHVQIDGQQMPSAGALSNRNLIINGAMQVAQRGTEVTGVTTSGYRTCDRWRVSVDSLGTWTMQQSTDAPDGYSNSFRLLCTAGDASPTGNDHCRIQYRIEAQDLQYLFSDKSAGDTYPITLSFWVKASRSGNASFAIMQSDNSERQFTASYNISATDTWERKVISIPVDDSAVINNDNGIGLLLEWYLHSGGNFTGGSHAAGWEASNNTNRNASNIGIGQATNDEFLISGVQLEVGSVATPFAHEPYFVTLAKCQRYFEIIDNQWRFDGNIGGNAATAGYMTYFKVTKRANSATVLVLNESGNNCSNVNSTANVKGKDGVMVNFEWQTTGVVSRNKAYILSAESEL